MGPSEPPEGSAGTEDAYVVPTGDVEMEAAPEVGEYPADADPASYVPEGVAGFPPEGAEYHVEGEAWPGRCAGQGLCTSA